MKHSDLKTGDSVVYHDELNRPHNALVIAVWSKKSGHPDTSENIPSLNLVMVNSDPGMDDTYGRQIVRKTSVVHKSFQAAPGAYWRLPDEEPIKR